MEHYSWRDEERRNKYDELKVKVKNKICDGLSWTVDHADDIVLICTVGGVLYKVGRKVNTSIKNSLYVWDPSLRMYMRIQRPISRSMKREISRRFSSGEALHDIYVSLGII